LTSTVSQAVTRTSDSRRAEDPSAVDRQHGSGHPLRVAVDEVPDPTGDLLRLPDPAERHSAIGEAIGRPEQTVGTHYLNPPLLMPPVEVIAGERTSREAIEFVRAVLLDLGKLPIAVQRDVPGFVWNRLQFALVRECAWLVESGVATAEEVDTVVREGLARRWRRIGPLRSIALGGIDTWNRSGRNIVPELSNTSELADLSGVAITGGDLVADAAARDAGLAGDLRHDHPRGGSS